MFLLLVTRSIFQVNHIPKRSLVHIRVYIFFGYRVETFDKSKFSSHSRYLFEQLLNEGFNLSKIEIESNASFLYFRQRIEQYLLFFRKYFLVSYRSRFSFDMRTPSFYTLGFV